MVELDFAVHITLWLIQGACGVFYAFGRRSYASGLDVAAGQDFSVGLQVELDLDDESCLDFATGLVMFISFKTYWPKILFTEN